MTTTEGNEKNDEKTCCQLGPYHLPLGPEGKYNATFVVFRSAKDRYLRRAKGDIYFVLVDDRFHDR